MQPYVIKFLSDLRQVCGFLRVLRVSSTNKTDCHDITEILFKVALNTINKQTNQYLLCQMERTHSICGIVKLCNSKMDCYIFSGLDQTPRKEGGTWLGASKTGRIGILLNILGINDPKKKGRGKNKVWNTRYIYLTWPKGQCELLSLLLVHIPLSVHRCC